jgi:hypothetical protein
MTYSEEQIQTTVADHSRLIIRHENQLIDQGAAILRHDSIMDEIKQNLAEVTQVLIRVANAQEEDRRQQDINSEQIATLTASITDLRNVVADMIRREGGTPTA